MPGLFRDSRTRRWLALLPAALLFAASSAGAESVGRDLDHAIGLSDSIDLKLTGRIVERCTLSGGQSINFGHLRGGAGVRAPFGLDCNVPFDIDILSSRGGLVHTTQPLGEGPFAGALEYDLTLTVPMLRPDPATVRASFGSQQLMAKRTVSSGDGIAAGNGMIEVVLRNPTGAGLLAGQYAETLRLTVTPRM